MPEAVGSVETRPWLPEGLSLGFTSAKTEKSDYPDGRDERYDKRVGAVIIVNAAREPVSKRIEDEGAAQAWLESLSDDELGELMTPARDKLAELREENAALKAALAKAGAS